MVIILQQPVVHVLASGGAFHFAFLGGSELEHLKRLAFLHDRFAR